MYVNKSAQAKIDFPPIPPQSNSGYFKIVAAGAYLPDQQKSTAQLLEENALPLKAAIVNRVSGVETRHVARANQSDSDMLALAAQECFEQSGVKVDTVTRIFVNKLLGDRVLPPTAALVQRKLGAHVAIQSMDIDGGSNGFLQAFLMAGRCLEGGDERILILSGGIHQRLMNPVDSRTAFLFGDAATAVLLEPDEQRHLLAQYEFSDPGLAHLHHGVDFYQFVPKYLREKKLDIFAMENIQEASEYYLHAASHVMTSLLQIAQCDVADIDMFLINQMNLPLWSAIVSHLSIPKERVISVLPHTGNTFSANIPLQLCQWQRNAAQLSNKKMMMISLGEGLLGGGCIYQF